MATTYEKLTREIEILQKRAEAARKQEAADMVAVIRKAIVLYGLTALDLGLASGNPPARTVRHKPPTAQAKPAVTNSATRPAAKYTDGAGHAWSGRGPRPGWVKAALEGGQSLDDLLATAHPRAALADKAAGKTSKRVASPPAKPARYQDDAGHSWSGRGPKPGWLRSAIEAGQSLDDFLA
jgi:DNA-binding protein H-NS